MIFQPKSKLYWSNSAWEYCIFEWSSSVQSTSLQFWSEIVMILQCEWTVVLNQIPHFYNDEYLIRGKVGKDLTVEAAYEAARSCALALLGTLKDEVDDLDSVQIVKIHGFVNCVDGFSEHSKVINGASDFLVEVLGPERGRHCRIGKSLSIHFTVNCVLWKQFSLSLFFW